ncbi:hypothetical protein VPH35_096815 [Triticum aestivum]
MTYWKWDVSRTRKQGCVPPVAQVGARKEISRPTHHLRGWPPRRSPFLPLPLRPTPTAYQHQTEAHRDCATPCVPSDRGHGARHLPPPPRPPRRRGPSRAAASPPLRRPPISPEDLLPIYQLS